MITKVHIQNFRSFLDAEVALEPFSLVVGANGAGKSNFLRFLNAIARAAIAGGIESTRLIFDPPQEWVHHSNAVAMGWSVGLSFADGSEFTATSGPGSEKSKCRGGIPWAGKEVPIFNLVPETIGDVERVVPRAEVFSDGSGTTQVLDILKNGDREDLFDGIESHFKGYVPEVEKLSLKTVKEGLKQIQVRERGLEHPLSATELSEGTRLILAVLTILHQESPPPVILLEDIDRGMHPRLFESMVPLMKDIAVRMGVNIIATTHNPYLVDAFRDDPKAVIVVEKVDGASTLTTLADKMEGLNYDEVDPDDLPLGHLWFSGLVGGVPRGTTAEVSG
jgi:energy-coupling factor transporter ATP-binding protein EcfA2